MALQNPVWTDALGESNVFLEFLEHISAITDSERPVLVLGERGSGKELAAQRIHYMSRRWDKPFVTLLCTALNPNLLEAELFGSEAGAYTGARERRIGYFERADQGTLFLDEVADMPLPLQDKLLRVLEYGELVRVGGSSVISVDVRVVAATNRDVLERSREGLMRADLLDRLACEVVHVPPLRMRAEDALLLARHFANKMAVELGATVLQRLEGDGVGFSGEAVRQMREYPWPGNVRELKNVVERSLLRSRGASIDVLDLDPFTAPWSETGQRTNQEKGQGALLGAFQGGTLESRRGVEPGLAMPRLPDRLPQGFNLHETVAGFEEQAVRTALAQARHKQKEAARLLGLSYHQFRALYRKLESRKTRSD